MLPAPPVQTLPRVPVLALLCCAIACLAAPAAADAQRRAGAIESASRATVFLRVVGDLDITRPESPIPLPDDRLHRANVEIATGSGFLISPLGEILTCDHVVADGERTGLVDGRKAKVTVTVRRIEAFVSGADGAAPQRYEASILARNEELDLAVLSIGGAYFPVADLGDSDALEPGDGLDALGFPFGRDVEIGRPASAELVAPDVSVSHGDFSAFRADTQGTRRFLQTSAIVNPGNSGGPILDGDGFVVGIVSRRLSAAGTAIGFAVPINLAKDFLESKGLDAQLPARRLTLGPAQTLEGKGLRMRLPWGMADTSPFRARVDSGANPSAQPALRIDRILSPWDVVRLADSVSSGLAFEGFATSTSPVQRVRFIGGRRVVTGRVTGSTPEGGALRVEYAVADLGLEKVIARFAGPPALIAFNASIFRASLESVEPELLRRVTPPIPPPAAWVVSLGAGATSPLREVPFPAGWVVEPQGPLPCRGASPAAEGLSAAPVNDFARSLRAGVLRRPGASVADVAAACGAAARTGAGDYQATVTSFGSALFVAGRIVAVGNDQFLQFEVVGPAEQRASLQELLALWMVRLDTSTAPPR